MYQTQSISIHIKNSKKSEQLTSIVLCNEQQSIDPKSKPLKYDQIPTQLVIDDYFRPIEQLKTVKKLPYFYFQSYGGSSNLADQEVQNYLHYFKYLCNSDPSNPRPSKAAISNTKKYNFYLCPPENISSFSPETPLRCYYEEFFTPEESSTFELVGGIHPRDMKTRSESHVWIFGAFAELIHNSNDAKAKHIKIQVREFRKIKIIDIIDNGTGMSYHSLCQMLTYGHEDVDDPEGQRIGKFGVGFKTGAMRIADDALVLTKDRSSQSVGFFSQNYNEGKKKVDVPITTWTLPSVDIGGQHLPQPKAEAHLKTILEYSIINNPKMLQTEFFPIQNGGTHIILYNLREQDLDFEIDKEKDIKIPKLTNGKKFRLKRQGVSGTDIPIDYSLKEYCKMIFLEPKIKISILGELLDLNPPMNMKNIRLYYDPVQKVTLKLGFSEREKVSGLGGIHMYWHNILIRSYYRPNVMIDNSDKGNGVIGIIECNHMIPYNNKQFFQHDSNSILTEDWMSSIISNYIDEIKSKSNANELDSEHIQCSKCLKRRRLLPPLTSDLLPRKWYCSNNSDPRFNSCSVEQDPSIPNVESTISSAIPLQRSSSTTTTTTTTSSTDSENSINKNSKNVKRKETSSTSSSTPSSSPSPSSLSSKKQKTNTEEKKKPLIAAKSGPRRSKYDD